MAANKQQRPQSVSAVKALYRDPGLDCYRGNPLIEALPPIFTEELVARLLQYSPGYEEGYRELPLEYRLHLIVDAVRFIQPLPMHLRLEQCFSRMIRSGYVGRNPSAPEFQALYRRLQAVGDDPLELPPPVLTTRGCSIVGHSGAGKSTAAGRILSMYPQVIFHGRYNGRHFTYSQLVYIKLECPYNGELSGLCKGFFTEVDRLLDTNTYERYVRRGQPRIDDLLLRMAELAFRHSIGVLVIDEIQNLRKARGDGANDMLDFLLWLDNKLGIPVVLVGTPRALPVLTGEFRRARRAAGQEAIPWNRMREDGNDWTLFTDTLWQYQYVHSNSPLTPELRHVLYDQSQGIADIAVKVYMLAQIEAITSRAEVITAESLIAASQHRLSFVQPFLSDLRENVAPEKIEDPDDLAEVDLGQIVQEELDRIYGCSSQAADEGEHTQPQEGASAEAEQGQASQANVSSELLPEQGLRKQTGGAVVLALVQSRLEGKRQHIAPYRALNAGGYIRQAMEYLLTEMRGPSQEECA
jgi:hypothetical protein